MAHNMIACKIHIYSEGRRQFIGKGNRRKEVDRSYFELNGENRGRWGKLSTI